MRSPRRLPKSAILALLLLCGCLGESSERYAAEVRARAHVVGERLDHAFEAVTRDPDPLRASREMERLSRLSHQLQSVQTSASRAARSWDFSTLDSASERLTYIEQQLGMTSTE
jgi:hypothetical protein